MPNESGFVDFKQYADLNSDEEQQRLQQAMDAAEAQDDYAQKQLIKVRNSTTDGDITHSASYSDYLVAKQNAAKAWAAANMSGSDPRSGALRGSLNQSNNVVGQGQAAQDERNRREGVIAEDRRQGYVAGQKNKAAYDAYYAQIEADKKARAEADQKSKDDFNNLLVQKNASGWDDPRRYQMISNTGGANANDPWVQNGAWGTPIVKHGGGGSRENPTTPTGNATYTSGPRLQGKAFDDWWRSTGPGGGPTKP